MRRALIILVLLAAVGAMVAFGLYAYVDQAAKKPMDASATEKVEFEVPKGASLDKIGRLLVDQGFVSDFRIFKAYIRLHKGHEAKAGRHLIAKSMSMIEILDALKERPLPEDVPVTLVEGWRIRDTDEALSAEGWFEAGAYLEATKDPGKFELPFKVESLEGYLYPETYMVNRKKPLDVDQLVQRQLDAFVKRFWDPNKEEIKKSKRSLNDLVVMASMLEREEPKPALRPKVAGVLYKRLDKRTPLGVDATSRYTIDEWNDRKAFLKKLRDPDDPYNTRLKKGLPPTAIGGPSLPSLEAALRPVSSPYWYYLHDAKGNIHFARNGKEHEQNRRKYNVW